MSSATPPNPASPQPPQPNPPQPAAPGAAPPAADAIHHLEAQRRANREAIAKLGVNPYGVATAGLVPLAEARAAYSAEADAAFNAASQAAKDAAKAAGAAGAGAAAIPDHRPEVAVAGRVMLLRDNGKLIWLTLRDSSGDLQAAVSQKDVGPRAFALAKSTDLGDILIIRGRLMKTKTGEITVWAGGELGVEPGAKCLVPPPEKHAGLSDVELRYRQRYVDMWATPETTAVFQMRSRLVSRIRAFLAAAGYLEVETPMLQSLAGGAAARPFITHMNALGMPLYLRIAPELYLKRLLVGGLSKVFEVNRNFRNEGLDKQHNPEFTMLEAYVAFGDCRTVMTLTEDLIRDAAHMVADAREQSDLVLPFGDLKIDYAQPFRRITYGELFRQGLGFDMTEHDKVRAECERRHIKTKAPSGTPVDIALLINELFEEFGEKLLDPAVPTFITDYPAAISPLVRPKTDDPTLADRADLFIGGMEIAPHYTELNDPDVQAARFREQLTTADADKTAEEATYRTFDADFIQALKVGMPPAGGMGLGIDRLIMLLTDQRTIRDVVLFPLMRPLDAPAKA
jgi:lysyl-tRNA synthetase class 2